jgi:glycosyltransferase involved in cell wall biosynthesis
VEVAVVVEQLLAPVPGGTGRYSRELTAALAAGAPTGAGVAGWTAWHRDPTAARIAGMTGPRRLALPRRPLAEAWRHGRGPAPRGDVVHAPTLLLPPRRRSPLVATIHDAVPWTHPETLTTRGAAWHRAMGERAAAQADVVLVPTRAVADALGAHLDLRRVEVVGEGVAASVATAAPDADERARRLGLPDAYALVVGTLEPRKGLDVAVAATARPGWPDGLSLVLVGPTGWGELALPADGADRVLRLGRLSEADLATAYARASVVLVPSRAEGFGLPVLEAMTHRVPVVISDAPALVEVAGGAALVAPVGDADALASAVGQALAGRDELVRAGTARAAAWTWEAAAATCWEIYAGLRRSSS